MTRNLSINLSKQAQAVWNAKSIPEKKQLIRQMLDDCRFKKNLRKFEIELERVNITLNQLDRIAADLMLCDTDKVIQVTR